MGCTCLKCTNQVELVYSGGALETSAPPASAPPASTAYKCLFFSIHFSPSNPQPDHAPHHLPKPSFRHTYSVWSLASLVSVGGGAVYHLSSCRFTSSDQTAGVVTHARGVRTVRDKGWRADGRGRTFGRNSGGVVEDWIWRLCVEQCAVQAVC